MWASVCSLGLEKCVFVSGPQPLGSIVVSLSEGLTLLPMAWVSALHVIEGPFDASSGLSDVYASSDVV